MNLVIDIGNTAIKVSIFNDKTIVFIEKFSDLNKNGIQKIYNRFSKIQNIILSTVKKEKKEWISFLMDSPSLFFELNSNTFLPIKNSYKTPLTLGNDRIAAAVGATVLFPKENILVIDAGTAITYELITSDSEYLGGNISLGIETRFKALNFFTGKLPLIEKNEHTPDFGQNTIDAITTGVQKGLVFEIEGFISEYSKQFGDLKVILTGGDAFFFERMLKKTIFAQPNLVLIGLNRILQYNVENK